MTSFTHDPPQSSGHTTGPAAQPIDQPERLSAAAEVERSFALSAGAGAGKTSVLVNRIVRLLLTGVPPEHIAAITFTRAAATELMSRSRDAIEDHLEQATREGRSEEAARLGDILANFSRLTLSTIHAFCQTLLEAEALDAQWAPDTDVNDLQGAMALDGVYEAWRVDFDTRHPELIIPLRIKASEHSFQQSPSVRLLADTLAENRDLNPVVAEGDVIDWDSAHGELLSLRAEMLQAAARCRNPTTCKLIAKAGPYLTRIDALCAAVRNPQDCVMTALELDGPKVGNVGNSKDWDKADKQAIQQALKDTMTWSGTWRGRIGAQLHRTLVVDLKEHYLPALAQARLELAQVNYADLLFRSRELLMHIPEARQRLAERFRVLLIDEVQDTDPIQAEVAALLTQATQHDGLWHQGATRPGSLFAVGDPKQSIYRFRRADIQVWEQLQGLISSQGEALELSQNFRSVPGIVAWVNHVFEELPGFVPQQAFRPPAELDPVVTVGAASAGDEIDALVRHLVALKRSKVNVFDKDLKRMRPIRDSDIFVLLPSWTKAELVQEKMLLAGIECTVEGGKSFFDRDEIRLSMAALRAMEEPGDSEAIVCVLRGLFGIPFPELAAHRLAGGSWSYFHPSPPPGPVGEALKEMRRLHQERHRQSWVDLLDGLLDHTGAPAVWALTARRWNILANLDKLRAMIRQIEPTTRSSSEVIEILERNQSAGSEDQSLVDEDAGAARVMTYFKAKGLEAPVVALVHATRRSGSINHAIQRRDDGDWMAAKASSFVAPPGWSDFEASEKDALQEEQRRWMYVATTRARDQLVLVTSPKGGKLYKADVARGMGKCTSACHDAVETFAPAVPVRHVDHELMEAVPYDASTFPNLDTHVDALLAEETRSGDPEGERRRQRVLQDLAASKSSSTRWRSVGHLNNRTVVTFEGGGIGPQGGTIVHQVMEHLDLAKPTEELRAQVPSLVQAFGVLAGVSGELLERCQEVVTRLLELPVIDEARKAPERWREVDFAYPERGMIIAGKIDLCFPINQKRTHWKVVDWKSHLPREDSPLHERYRRQLAFYTRALLATVTPCQHVDAVLAGPHHEIGHADELGEVLEVVHPYLRSLVSELYGAGLHPEVGHILETRKYVELELAWVADKVGLGLDLSERELEVARNAGWNVVAIDTSVASWPERASEALKAIFELAFDHEEGDA